MKIDPIHQLFISFHSYCTVSKELSTILTGLIPGPTGAPTAGNIATLIATPVFYVAEHTLEFITFRWRSRVAKYSTLGSFKEKCVCVFLIFTTYIGWVQSVERGVTRQ